MGLVKLGRYTRFMRTSRVFNYFAAISLFLAILTSYFWWRSIKDCAEIAFAYGHRYFGFVMYEGSFRLTYNYESYTRLLTFELHDSFLHVWGGGPYPLRLPLGFSYTPPTRYQGEFYRDIGFNPALVVLPLFVTPVLWLWRRIKSAKQKALIPCAACGYDLHGHVGQVAVVCPECGTTVDGRLLPAPTKLFEKSRIMRVAFRLIVQLVLVMSFVLTVALAGLSLASFDWGYELYLQKKDRISIVLGNGDAVLLYSRADPLAYTPEELRSQLWPSWAIGDFTSFMHGGLCPAPLLDLRFPAQDQVPVRYFTGSRTGTYPEWGRDYSYLRLPAWLIIVCVACFPALYMVRKLSRAIQSRRTKSRGN